MSQEKTVLRQSLVAALALAAACSGSATPGSSSSKLTVLLTDAPAAFSAAVVTVTKVTLVGTGGETTLSTKATTTNLLTLANDAQALVDSAVVQAGTYSELRFYLSGGYVQVPGATAGSSEIFASSPTYEGLPAGAQVTGTLKMPSLAQSGLKVDFGSNVVIGTESKVVLVDFDVAQSFGHEAGNSGSWVMHPVVKGADLTVSGNVNTTIKLASGVTLPILTATQVTLGDFSAVLTNAAGSAKTLKLAPTASGSATFGASFKFLLPGSYSLTLAGPAGMSFTASPVVPLAVTVASGANAQADFTITAASAP